MRLFWINWRDIDNQNKESSLSKIKPSQPRNSSLLKNMKQETISTTLNSSTAFLVPTFKASSQLGWSEMPTFPASKVEPEVVLGWGAMPAFGQSAPACDHAELVADFVRETRAASSKAGLVKSFWNAVSSRA